MWLHNLSRVATDEERSSTSQQANESTSGDSLIVHFAAAGSPSTKLLGYTLTSQGRCHVVDTLTIGTRGCTRTIATASLPTGVYQLTLFDAEGAVYAQRLFFVDNGIPTETVSVTADRADYRPFDEIRLNLNVNNRASRRVNKPLSFSLAVRDAADYGTAYRDDIRTYMLLSSELKGLIEEPGWYFEASPQPSPKGKGATSGGNQFTPPSGGEGEATPLGGRLAALDLLMLVQGWTRYNWRQMAGVEPFKIRHYTEEQLVVDGWAFSRIKETPLEGVKIAVRLTSQDRQHRQETTVTTDSLGYWSVGVEDFEGEWDLYMETRQKEDKSGNKTTRVRLERSSKPALYAYQPVEKYIPDDRWNTSDIEMVKEMEDSLVLPSDAHLLQEVEVRGQRKYIDYYTFKAFDAHKDAELMLDEGGYTYKVMDYLRDKGYTIRLPGGQTWDDFIMLWPFDAELRRLYPVMEEIPDSLDYMSRTIYYQWVSEQAPINGFRTFWFIKEGNRDRTGPSYFHGFDLDLEEVKSIFVYDDPHMYSTFPAVRNLMTNRLIQECFEKPKKELGFPAGLYIVELELNRKRRTRVKKNARSTSFEGYSPVVEFYAPTYPNGPVQGDKDYRRTIYWNPEVTTDADGYASVSFFNNGYSRALTISAQGLTPDGVPIINQ